MERVKTLENARVCAPENICFAMSFASAFSYTASSIAHNAMGSGHDHKLPVIISIISIGFFFLSILP